MQEVIVL